MKYFILFILYLCIIPVYFVLRNETKPKKNIVLGVTLPYDARQDAAVQAICATFRRRLNLVTLGLVLLSLALLPIAYDSVFMTCSFVWIMFAVVLPYIPYIQGNKRLRAYKNATCPPAAAAGETLIELKLAALPKRQLHALWFLPPLIMALIPILHTLFMPHDEAFLWMLLAYGMDFLITLLFAALYRLINRQRADVVDENSALTAALTRVRRYQWGRAWVAFSWLNGLFSLGLWLLIDIPTGILLLTLVYTAALIAVCIRTEFAARRAQESLTAETGQTLFADEDRYWLWGMFYCNPHDKHLTVNNRVGIGMTLNFAHWGGKLIFGISALLLLAMPLLGVWMMRLEFTPIAITLDEDTLTVVHTGVVCELERAQIESVALLETLPPLTKLAGTNLDSLYEGKFRAEGYGLCQICLNPQAPPYLLIQTAEEAWIFGAEHTGDLRAIYAALAAP